MCNNCAYEIHLCMYWLIDVDRMAMAMTMVMVILMMMLQDTKHPAQVLRTVFCEPLLLSLILY